jgi:putative membrane protein
MGGVFAVLAVLRWQRVQSAMRQGADLPRSPMPMLLGALIFVVAVLVIAVIFIQP